MINKILENLFSNLFSLLIGAILTVLSFYLTSSASTPEEVKKDLISKVSIELKKRHNNDVSEIEVAKYFTKELDIGSEKSVFVLGYAEDNDELLRWVAIFENQSPTLLDKIVGRSSSLKISSLTTFAAPFIDTLLFNHIESLDVDNDGVSEVHVRLKSHYADSTDTGLLLYKKNLDGEWQLLGLPSSESTLSALTPPRKKGLTPSTHFGMVGDENLKIEPISGSEMIEMPLYEHVWTADHNSEQVKFTTLRNGGEYLFTKHGVRGHSQLQVLSFFKDGNSTLGAHFAVVSVYSIDTQEIVPDLLWNWGYPMFSVRPADITEIDLSSILQGGIMAHTQGDIFFGYTEFEKTKPHR
ncbi:hypothetical protein [Vibrio campbellii]|uniref:hypothetical protein n=1 Tax=Vibrio campbellii TaxID=680 RepID=UPI000682B573|nr:hypothetical protein [Vibrio campbellii]